MRITEIVASRERIPAMTHYSNFWYSVSSVNIGDNVSSDTTKQIGKALELVAEKTYERPKLKETPRQIKLPLQVKL